MNTNREQLLSKLSAVKPAVAAKARTAELAHIWFDKKTIFAFDGGLGIRLDYESDLEIGIPGDQLIKLLGTSPLKEVEIGMDRDVLALKMGRSKTKLNVMPIERSPWHYPEQAPRGAPRIEFSAGDIQALRTALIVKANPAVRVEHHGVILQSEEGRITAYATDSATILSMQLPEAKLDKLDRVLVPRPLVEQMCELCAKGAILVVAEDCIYATAEGVAVYTNMLDATDLKDLTPVLNKHLDAHPKPLEIPPGFVGALERAAILCGEQDPIVNIEIAKGKMAVTGSYKGNELNEQFELEAKRSHPDTKLRIDAKHLQKALPLSKLMSITEASLVLEDSTGDLIFLAAAADR